MVDLRARLGLALVSLSFAALVFCWSADARAYLWMIRHGYAGCITCHADPSGGETLTPYGRAQGDLVLRMRYGHDAVSAQATPDKGLGGSFDSFDSFDTEGGEGEKKAKPEPEKAEEPADAGPSPTAGFLWGLFELPDWLLLGGSYRHANLYSDGDFRTFPMQADIYGEMRFEQVRVGGSIGVARVKAGSPYARMAQVTTNQGNELNLISRNHWIGFDFDEYRQVTLRAGRMNLPFGLRIPEHIAWVRQATRTDRESAQQHGLALAYNGSALRGEAMFIAGNYQINPDDFRERGYSLFVETSVTDGFATGISSLYTVAQADLVTLDLETTSRGVHGAFARVRLVKALVAMIEADAMHTSRRELGYVGFLQLDYEPVQGLHFMATGEVLDQGYYKEEDIATGLDLPRERGVGKPRLGGWLSLDWFFLPHMEARIDAIARQDSGLWLLGQLHVYL